MKDVQVWKTHSTSGTNANGGACLQTAYEISIPDEEMPPRFLSWFHSPREPNRKGMENQLKDIIEEELGERPSGELHEYALDEPQEELIRRIGELEPESMQRTGNYIISVEFSSSFEMEADEDGEEYVKRMSGIPVVTPNHSDMLMEGGREKMIQMLYEGVENGDIEPHEAFESIEEGEYVEVEMTEEGNINLNKEENMGSWVNENTAECTECEEQFEEREKVEGDNGDPFCSLRCLNNHVNP